jgi:phosphocarrier protein HPr
MTNPPPQIEAEVTITNSQGLHVRPVFRFVELAGRYQARVRVRKPGGNQEVDGKSAMEMMLLNAPAGTQLKLVGEGEDAAEAIAALTRLIQDKFYED